MKNYGNIDPDYGLNRLLPKGKNKKIISSLKDDLGEKIKQKFLGLEAKTYSYLIDDGKEDKNPKRPKQLLQKR